MEVTYLSSATAKLFFVYGVPTVGGRELTGVHVGGAASGAAVLVGGRVAVGVTMLTGTISNCPT